MALTLVQVDSLKYSNFNRDAALIYFGGYIIQEWLSLPIPVIFLLSRPRWSNYVPQLILSITTSNLPTRLFVETGKLKDKQLSESDWCIKALSTGSNPNNGSQRLILTDVKEQRGWGEGLDDVPDEDGQDDDGADQRVPDFQNAQQRDDGDLA